jgi:hypothetical protein
MPDDRAMNSTALTISLNFDEGDFTALFGLDFGFKPDDALIVVADARWAYDHEYLPAFLRARERIAAARLARLLRPPKTRPVRLHPARPPKNPFPTHIPIVRGHRRH